MDEQNNSETLITFGGAVKSLGDGRVGGYLVRFTSDEDLDLEGDYFDATTDYACEFPGSSKAWFSHALYPQKKRLSSDADMRLDEFGIWAETVLDERDKYEAFLLGLAEQNKLGWSSGTASHLVEREKKVNGYHITCWPLGLDASLTHAPAEARNEVLPLKTFSDNLPPLEQDSKDEPEAAYTAGSNEDAKGATTQEPIIESNNEEEIEMADNIEEVKTIEMTEAELTELVTNAAEAAATKGAEAALKALPVEPKPEVKVVHDEADNEFKSLAEQCRAIKSRIVTYGRDEDPRLRRLDVKGAYGTGASEGVPSEGGYMLEPALGGEILRPMHETGPFTSQVSRTTTSNAYGWYFGVDETSRATGSRWGGIRGYRLAEGDSITASKPAFKRINWALKKYAVLVYATDELLADAPLFSQIVREGCGEELAFMANDDIVNGLGANGPLGMLASNAKVAVTAATGQAATTFIWDNVVAMWARLPARSKASAVWYINTDVNPQIDAMALAVGTGGLEPRFIDYDSTGVLRMKGRPVVETEFNATLGTEGDVILADPLMYRFWEKTGGVQAASSIHVNFTTDEEVFRFTYRCDGQCVVDTALTPYKGSNTLSPIVTVATRT